METLVDYKLTHTTVNVSEGYSNEFNNIVSSLELQSQMLVPQILKGIFLRNVKDNLFENIRKGLGVCQQNTSSHPQASC